MIDLLLSLKAFGRWLVRTQRRAAITIVLVSVLTATVTIVHYLSAPAQGRMVPAADVGRLAKHPAVRPKLTPAQQLTNAYFRLALPPGYAIQASDPTPAGLLYDQTITKPGDFGSLIIAISVQRVPAGGLDSDSSYTFREQQPATYHFTTQQVAGDSVHIASDPETGSVVVFWPHGGYLATVSVGSGTDAPSGDDNADILRALQPLLSAWQWR